MKDATVTIAYNSFQEIKDKADKYDALLKENQTILNSQGQFIETLCNYFDLASEQSTAKNKQFFIAQAIRTFCKHFEMDVDVEYENLDNGVAPKGYNENKILNIPSMSSGNIILSKLGGEILKESDLFEPVKRYLLNDMGCQKVYAEVCNHDVVALVGEQTIIVEMKKMLNFKVIEQAIYAKERGNYVFIAVPDKKSGFPNIVKDFLKYHGIGLMVVNGDYAEIPYGMFAKCNRKVSDIKRFIKDGYHDNITGGCKMGDFDYQSDYTLMIDDLKRFFERRPNKWFTVSEILEHVQCYYRSPKSQLAATLKAHWNRDWVEHQIINRKSHFKLKV